MHRIFGFAASCLHTLSIAYRLLDDNNLNELPNGLLEDALALEIVYV